jgi:hypothetical protein
MILMGVHHALGAACLGGRLKRRSLRRFRAKDDGRLSLSSRITFSNNSPFGSQMAPAIALRSEG